MLNTIYLWNVITHLGSASLLLPVLALSATGLWQSRQQAAVRIWLCSLALAVAVTLSTKILFLGWGIGIALLDFTGISGHALLATSVLPVFFNWLMVSDRQRISVAGIALGLLLCVAVGTSRVVLGAHSASEVVAAWLAGVLVSGLALKAMRVSSRRGGFARFSPLVLLLALGTSTSTFLPTHDWEVDLSLALSGRQTPYTRHQLMRRSPEQLSCASLFSREGAGEARPDQAPPPCPGS